MCLRVYVSIYSFHACVTLCLKLFRATCAHFSRAYVQNTHLQNILRLTSIPCISVFLWIIKPFIPFKTSIQTPASKTAYPKPILWGFAISTGACTETIT